MENSQAHNQLSQDRCATCDFPTCSWVTGTEAKREVSSRLKRVAGLLKAAGTTVNQRTKSSSFLYLIQISAAKQKHRDVCLKTNKTKTFFGDNILWSHSRNSGPTPIYSGQTPIYSGQTPGTPTVKHGRWEHHDMKLLLCKQYFGNHIKKHEWTDVPYWTLPLYL